jgi:hypothetical protein
MSDIRKPGELSKVNHNDERAIRLLICHWIFWKPLNPKGRLSLGLHPHVTCLKDCIGLGFGSN